VLGLVLVIVVGCLTVGEHRFHESNALRLEFDGTGTPCVELFPTAPTEVGQSDTSYLTEYASTTSVVTLFSGQEPPEPDAVVIRLHARNLRSRQVSQVRVRLREIKRERDGTPLHYSSWLKWRHDDGQANPESVSNGISIRPGVDPDAYLDLATKAFRSRSFHIDFAMKHLRDRVLPASEAYLLHLEATGRDDETGRRVPECHSALRLGVDARGHFTVEPRPLAECSF
jgi:hypothetical protein